MSNPSDLNTLFQSSLKSGNAPSDRLGDRHKGDVDAYINELGKFRSADPAKAFTYATARFEEVRERKRVKSHLGVQLAIFLLQELAEPSTTPPEELVKHAGKIAGRFASMESAQPERIPLYRAHLDVLNAVMTRLLVSDSPNAEFGCSVGNRLICGDARPNQFSSLDKDSVQRYRENAVRTIAQILPSGGKVDETSLLYAANAYAFARETSV